MREAELHLRLTNSSPSHQSQVSGKTSTRTAMRPISVRLLSSDGLFSNRELGHRQRWMTAQSNEVIQVSH